MTRNVQLSCSFLHAILPKILQTHFVMQAFMPPSGPAALSAYLQELESRE
jgi:hypothetical protein